MKLSRSPWPTRTARPPGAVSSTTGDGETETSAGAFMAPDVAHRRARRKRGAQ